MIYHYRGEKNKKSSLKFENGELILNFPPLTSAYAKVYQDFYHSQNPRKSDSLVNSLLESGQTDPKNTTFEYSLSQITYNFKALVDYIWYNSKDFTPEGVLQALDYDHLKDFKCNFLFVIF